MKYHRQSSNGGILRDSTPAYLLSGDDEITCKEIASLNEVKLTSQTCLWVTTQSRTIAVKSPMHLFSALLLGDPELQTRILQCDTGELGQMQIREIMRDYSGMINVGNFTCLAKYTFGLAIVHCMDSCSDALNLLSRDTLPIGYHISVPNKGTGVVFYDEANTDVFHGHNLLGRALRMAVDDFNGRTDKSVLLPPECPATLLGLPLRLHKRKAGKDDAHYQPNLQAAVRAVAPRSSTSAAEKFLTD